MLSLVFICIVLVQLCLLLVSRKPKNFPPGPKCLPILGNILQLKSYSKKYGGQYLALSKLAEEYKTDVLGLKLAKENLICVFSYALVRQVLTSEEYEGRPNTFFLKLRCMGEKRGVTCTDGEVWSTHRNFLVRHLRNVGFGKSPMEEMIQEELVEMKSVVDEMQSKVRISRLIAPSVLSVLWGLTAGRRISRNDTQLNLLLDLFYRRSRAFDMSGGLLSQFPFLRFVAPEKSGFNLISNINEELKSFFMQTIKEHHETWTPGKADDVIYAFINEMKKENGCREVKKESCPLGMKTEKCAFGVKSEEMKKDYFTDDQLMMICLDVFLAGAETTGNTVDYAFLLMLLYPEVQLKVQDTLDKAFTKSEKIRYLDRYKVPYVEAVLYEAERFCHVVPICGPRRVLKDTVLNGYDIPKDTSVLISLHSVFKDPEIWGDPEVFRPERFLDGEGKLVSSDKLVIFGLGKRRCLGETLAKSCIFLFFAGILKDYSVEMDTESKTPTLKPLGGITLSPEKYSVYLKRR